MNGNVTLRQVRESDRDQIIAILNHYAANGYAAYPEKPVPEQFFPSLREGTFSFSVIDSPEGILGFGLTKPFLPFPTFSRSCMLTYFIRPECVNRGLGTKLLDRLGRDARKMGLVRMVANMSSRNHASVRFHKKHGFEEAGRLRNVGVKFGEPFDVIWMQKTL